MQRDQATSRDTQGLFLQAILQTIKTTTALMRWVVPGLLVVYLLSGISKVQPKETGLRYRFGQLVGQPCPPGLVWALPPPFERVVTLPTAQELEIELLDWKDGVAQQETARNMARDSVDSLGPADGYTLSGDANVVRGEFVARYRITDPVRYLAVGDDREKLLRSLAYQSLAHVLAENSIDDATTQNREKIRLEIHRAAQTQADALKLGVTFTGLELRQLAAPLEVMPAFQEVTSAQLVAKTLLEDAHTYRAEQLPRIRAEDSIIRQEASTRAHEQVAKAQGESVAFEALLAEYRKTPALIRSRLYTETLREVVSRVNSSVLIPGHRDAPPTLMIEPEPMASETP